MTSLHQLRDVKHPIYAREIHNANIHYDVTKKNKNKQNSVGKICTLSGFIFYLVVILGTERKLSRVEEKAKRSGDISALRVV